MVAYDLINAKFLPTVWKEGCSWFCCGLNVGLGDIEKCIITKIKVNIHYIDENHDMLTHSTNWPDIDVYGHFKWYQFEFSFPKQFKGMSSYNELRL